MKIIKRKQKSETQIAKQRFTDTKAIYNIIKLLNDESKSFEELFAEIAKQLTEQFKQSGNYVCCINYDRKVYAGAPYGTCVREYLEEVVLTNGKKFSIEIYCDGDLSEKQSLFSEEEIYFINTVLELISVYCNKKIAYTELKRSKTNLYTILENTNTAYLLLDKDYKIISFNRQMLNGYFFAGSLKLSKGENFIDYLNKENQDVFLRYFDVVNDDKNPFVFEQNFERNKVKYYFMINIIPVLENGSVQGYNLSALDITARKNYEKERQKIIDDLLQRNRDLEQFSYIVSHNIRSPLATLIGLSDILQTGLTKDEVDFVVNGLRSSAQTLDTMVKDLNTILEVKKDHSQEKVEVNLNKKMVTILGSLDTIIKNTGATIEYDFSEAPVVKAIKPYIQSIIYNLISNAIKYAGDGVKPMISIWSKAQDKQVFVYFSDNGMGIDLEKYKSQIFGLYKKLHLGKEGKGMGLFMVKTQVEAMGGTISVESTPGKGSLFTVSLPME